ncbi:hypothetical protein OKA04_03760 [Luteolibacter flavescens]|uniref:EF-hand domain-containing protein n=1 Tax=Luteolibacter flavescens TaxID=1859460 RepID=A0ABT3FKF6_9BACT|nr:hypothetical protein [Luteolibacter flavescens]MCW1883829.1 hypothetical protein [Luteolibacter flavescens]
MIPLPKFRTLFAGLLLGLAAASTARADVSDLLFTVKIEGNTNEPTISVTNNSPNLDITRFEFTIGNTAKNFDGYQQNVTPPPGGTANRTEPTSGNRSDKVAFDLTNFGPGETFSFQVDVDTDGHNDVQNYKNVFFNLGGNTPNSVATVWSGAAKASRTLPSFPNPLPDDQNAYAFRGPSRILRVISTEEEGGGPPVRGVVVKRDGIVIASNENEYNRIEVAHGDRIQIVAQPEVFKNIHAQYITDPETVKNQAEERFVAIGMSVNNIAQTADPTNYDFEISRDTDVQVKWQHYYALTVRHDFSKTQSQEVIAGTPWAGPLASDASGNPSPPASRQWVLKGSQPVVQIDGFVLDNFSHPGLDIRHVVKGYRAYGPPNNLVSSTQNSVRLAPDLVDIRAQGVGTVISYAANGTDTMVTNSQAHTVRVGDSIEITGSSEAAYNGTFTVKSVAGNTFTLNVPFTTAPVAKGLWRNVTYVKLFNFPTVEPRQQVKPNFLMYGPAGITYVWQIQYGVRLNADDPNRVGLAKVYEVTPGGDVDRTVQDGVSWFDPGTRVKVVTAKKEPIENGLSATGWVNGDGYYFAAMGEIDPSSSLPTTGSPAVVNGGPVATWLSNGPAASLGYEIMNLQRPVRMMWRYGAGAIVVNVIIGKHCFEDYPAYASMFTQAPNPIINAVPEAIAIAPGGAAPGAEMMAEWDPVSARLFPTIPGRFTVPWRPGNSPTSNPVEVRVVATLPNDSARKIRGHYPHIQGAPAVALDPDPTDSFSFKSIKYSTAGASVDANKKFITERPGISVLLFSQLQSGGRGQPREFLQVRVVDTRPWDVDLAPVPKQVTVGEKILDPTVDRANLGTGYVLDLSGRARYNPFIYNGGKMDGIASKDVYDMALLRADASSLKVLNKAALPGPVIPVNEHPGVPDRELPIVVWYDDPRTNDTILWPYVSRIYKPVWPSANTLPQIVVASQLGSDGKNGINQDQIVAPAIGTTPAATSYDPSRIQAVQIYNQPDFNAPGYNPNEEHALVAPSLRFLDVSPRPPAIYALRTGDLNYSNPSVTNGDARYTSHPYVLAQFFDVAADEVKMKAYAVKKESANGENPAYRFANNFTASTTSLRSQPFVSMKAGEPVIPFYPLGVAIGASPAPETFGNNILSQETYWEDWRGSYWSISGGDRAWFNVSFYYPLAPDFWWPPTVQVPPVKVDKNGATYTAAYDASRNPKVPGVGDSVAFLPSAVKTSAVASNLQQHLPTRVIYKSEWPDNPAVLKAGETLTFSGGEYRADNPTRVVVNNGVSTTVQTPGLPQLTAFASAEVVFDSLNPDAIPAQLKSRWTARVVQALDKRFAPLAVGSFPSELQPASGRTTVKQGKYVFNDLPASLQKRLRYDPLSTRPVTVNGVTSQVPGVLEFSGLLNDKDIGNATLTASPPAVYSLEPNILTTEERDAILALVEVSSSARTSWASAVNALYNASRNPEGLPGNPGEYLTGLMKLPRYGPDGKILKDELGNVLYPTTTTPTPMRAYGPGLALVPNGDFLNPTGTLLSGSPFPDESWVTVVENNDPTLGGSPITPHVVKVDRRHRYRGSVQTVLSDNVFDENINLRSTGDFGANADDLVFEWWYRPDDGSLNVPPPDLIPAGQPNPWKLFPDPSGQAGKARYQITLKGNPNAPEALLADTFWFARYRHKNDNVSGTNWKLTQPGGRQGVNFTWAGAGNSQPFVDADLDGFPDFRAQLAQGWIKRVLDAVNPYEARIRDFEGDAPSTLASMVAQFGARYEGPVALNPAKNVIENVGLIELYQTLLNRGRNLSIDLSTPVSTPAISNALQLAATRISDFYTLLGNEAYVDAGDPTIGHGSDSADYGSLATSVFTFQNQMSSQIEEELALLRGVDDYFARPVYNRLFWNFTKGEGEAAYATSYNISDINADGFINEDDAMMMFPQGHGDAWGHYLTALRSTYDLLRHPAFNWVSRAESYNLQDVVLSVDFLDERKFATTAAAKAKAAAEIVNLTYRNRYVADPESQWQGYTDTNADRAWGVDEWSRRAGQGAYFDWVTANALLPSQHPNTTLDGIRKVDRQSNGDIAVISANLNSIQSTMDQADRGYNPLGLAKGAQMFDIEPAFIENASGGDRRSHFDQIFERASSMMENATEVWDQANTSTQMLRQIGNSEEEFRNSTFQEDLSYRNQLITIFGKPYDGTVGPGRLYPAGYNGPDLALYMYVPIRQINSSTVPGPTAEFAAFNADGTLKSGTLYNAFLASSPSGSGNSILNKATAMKDVEVGVRELFASTFANASNSMTYSANTKTGMFAVNYTDLTNPKVNLTNFVNQMPVTAAGYTFQAPQSWGSRPATGQLQDIINQMIQQEASVAEAVAAWDKNTQSALRVLRLVNARLTTSGLNQGRDEVFVRVKYAVNNTIKVLETAKQVVEAADELTWNLTHAAAEGVSVVLPTGGLAISPGDALAMVRSGIEFSATGTRAGFTVTDSGLTIGKLIAEIALDVAENELNLAKADEERKLQIKEWLKEAEDAVNDEATLRIAIFKEIQALRALSDQYRTLIDEGARLIDERAAFNKGVAAQTQKNRYQDMTFRVARNHALQNYRSAFDLAARYAYLAASAYDYETNFSLTDPASPVNAFGEIIKARSLDSISRAIGKVKANHDVVRTQIGLNNEQREVGDISMRREFMRILDSEEAPEAALAAVPGDEPDTLWRQELQKARVPDLWQVAEFRQFCRPFAAAVDATGKQVPQPGIVLRFSSDISTGKNFFGNPLSGGDHAYSVANFATKIFGVGVTFDGYQTGSVLNDMSATPRVYFVPAGMDVMRVSNSTNTNDLRTWKVVEQKIPAPMPATSSQLTTSGYIPLLDGLNGRFGDARKFSDFRAYPDSVEEPTTDIRLLGRSIWNTQWLLIIPGATLNADPNVGLDRFVDQVSDIKLIFDTYGQSGG